MTLGRFTDNALSDWMKREGPDSDIVISSRIRIARNLRPFSFPMLATNQQSKQVLDHVEEASRNEELETISHFEFIHLSDMKELEKMVLVEKHLISPALANDSRMGL